MGVASAVRQQLRFWHDALQGMADDCGPELLNEQLPGATITSIASIYAHVVCAEDAFLQMRLRDLPSIYESEGWQARTGIAFVGMPPALTPEWAKSVTMDLGTFRPYAQAVFAATDAYLEGLSDAELERKVQGGEQTVEWYLAMILATHVPQHAGEIAALKGVRGLKGLPF